MSNYKVVLSDAGDILFEVAPLVRAQQETLLEIVNKNRENFSLQEIYQMFKPYKILSHTKISIEKTIDDFFQDYNIKSSFNEYNVLLKSKIPRGFSYTLFDDITETLEKLHDIDIPFIILTDGIKEEDEIYPRMKEIIINQLKERNNYKAEKFWLSDYISRIISSRTFGMKKSNPKYFDCLWESGLIPFPREEAVFVAHEFEEISNALKSDISVIALNYWKEHNVDNIVKKIEEYKKKEYPMVYPIEKFSDILDVIFRKN